MPRKLPPHVERNHVKGHTYLSFRRGKGPRVRSPKDPTSEEFMAAYQAALLGQPAPVRDRFVPVAPGTIAALIASYMKSHEQDRLHQPPLRRSAPNTVIAQSPGSRGSASSLAFFSPTRIALVRRSIL
jgi:hypothetical protein